MLKDNNLPGNAMLIGDDICQMTSLNFAVPEADKVSSPTTLRKATDDDVKIFTTIRDLAGSLLDIK